VNDSNLITCKTLCAVFLDHPVRRKKLFIKLQRFANGLSFTIHPTETAYSTRSDPLARSEGTEEGENVKGSDGRQGRTGWIALSSGGEGMQEERGTGQYTSCSYLGYLLQSESIILTVMCMQKARILTHSLNVITPIAQVSHFSLYSLFCVISGAASKNVIAM